MRYSVLTLAAGLTLLLLVVFPPWGTSLSQPPSQVVVTNLPNVQRIEGEVSVAGVVRQAQIQRRPGLIVPTVAREAVTDLISADVLQSDSFSQVTVSLHGEARGTIEHEGWIGVVLIPDETAVLEMLNDHGAFHFPIELKAKLSPKGPAHFNVQQRFDLGFTRYRVYLYNTSDRTVDANVYFYLTQ